MEKDSSEKITDTESEHKASGSGVVPSEDESEPKASTSSSKPAQSPLTTDDIKKWNTEQVIAHLQNKFPNKFREVALNILLDSEIEGLAFLELTEEKLMAYGMKPGPATIIDTYVKELNANQAESSKRRRIQTFHIIVKPKTTTTFAWDVNTNECTINDLKNYITASYPEMTEEAENARVVIFVDKESRIMVDDTHLRTTLKAFAKSGIEKFTVTFQTPKKAYNKWSIKEVLTEVLNSDASNYSQLPPLNIGQLFLDNAIPDFKEDRTTAFINNLKKIYRAFKGAITTNEATSRNFINPFMVEAIHILDEFEPLKTLSKELKRTLLMLAVEYDLNGSLGTGKVDYVILFLTFSIIITEAKMESLPQGIAQNIIQLHSAYESLKRKRDQKTPALPAVYGIISTGDRWLFTRWEVSSGNPMVQISEQYNCSFNGDMKNEMEVLKIITTILSIQALTLCNLYRRGEIEIDQHKEDRKEKKAKRNEDPEA